ncbi:MAG: Uma2 family endonuclease [Chloroflexota bacterium]
MRTMFVTDPPPEVQDWLERRRALGQDLYDEVWEGDYHVAPAPSRHHARIQAALLRMLWPLAEHAGLEAVGPINIGSPSSYRVPDLACLRGSEDRVWNPTAAIVVEVVSSGDESRRKLAFYHQAGVEEVLIVDPELGTAEWFARGVEGFEPAGGSALLGLTSDDIATLVA